MVGFIWDDANLEPIAAHGVTATEAEAAIYNEPLYLFTRLADGESRDTFIDITDESRDLTVVTTDRLDDIRVVTAFDATPKRIRLYTEGSR